MPAITCDTRLNKDGSVQVSNDVLGEVARILRKDDGRWFVFPYVFPAYHQTDRSVCGINFVSYQAAEFYALAIAYEQYATRGISTP